MTIIRVFTARCLVTFIIVPIFLLMCLVNFIFSILLYFIPVNQSNKYLKTIYRKEEGLVKSLINDLLFITYLY